MFRSALGLANYAGDGNSVIARRTCFGAAALIVVAFVVAWAPARAQAVFGISSFAVTPSTTQAAAHPDVDIYIERSGRATEDLKDIYLDFPAGLLGNPEAAVPKCTEAEYQSDACPAGSTVGSMRVTFTGGSARVNTPGNVYLMESEPGYAATIGFIVRPQGSRKIFFKSGQKNAVGIRSDGDFGLSNTILNIPNYIEPTDSSRIKTITIDTIQIKLYARSGVNQDGAYFMVNPTRCDNAAPSQLKAVDYNGATASASASFTPTGCLAAPGPVPFDPGTAVAMSPTTAGNASAPTFTLTVPTADAVIQNSHVRSITVNFPVDTGLNFPEISNIAEICSAIQLSSDTCPAGSRIGSASAEIPYLPPAFSGDLYLMGKGTQIKFGFVLRGPRGVKAAVQGSASTTDSDGDGADDSVVARFINLPEFPFSRVTLGFERPVLINSFACNPTVKSTVTGYSGASVTSTAPLALSECGGPALTVNSPVESQAINSGTVNVNFSVGADATTVTCQLDTGTIDTACVSPKQYTGLKEGSHKVTVKASNSAATTTVARGFVIDLTAPTLSVTSPTEAQKLATPSVSVAFTASADAVSVTCALDSATAAACTSPTLYEPVLDGAHKVTVVAKDKAGNAATVVRNFTVNAPPYLKINSPAEGDTIRSATVAVEFTVAGQTSVTCDIGGTQVDTACVSPKSFTGITNGTYAINVKAADADGKTTTAVVNVTVIAGLSLVVDSPTEGQVLSSGTVNVAFTAYDATGVTCKLDAAKAVACTSPYTYSGVADGSHTVVLVATDAAANKVTVTRNFAVDTVPPTLTIDSPTEGQILTSGTVSVSFTAADANLASTTCKLDGGATEACTSPKSYAGVSAGSHNVTVAVTDKAGNLVQVVRNFSVDLSAPDLVVSAPTEGQVLTSSTVGVTFTTGADAVTKTCQLDSGTVDGACVSPKQYTGVADGAHTATVKAADSAGNTRTVVRNFSVDTTGPAITITSPADGSLLNSSTVTVSFTTGSDSTGSTCQLDTGTVAGCTSPASFTGVADGAHSVKVTAKDAAGNVSSATVGFTIDTVPPTLTIDSPTEGAVLSSASVSVSFTVGSDSTGSTCALDAAAAATCTSPVSYSGVADGSHKVTVTAKDAAGNVATAVRNFSVSTGAAWPVTMTVTTTSTQAAAHPDVTVQLDIGTPDIKTADIKLPKGLWGSLASVTQLCTVADANAGNCAAASKVGTASADAKTSAGLGGTASGDAFLTEPPTSSDVAGLAMKLSNSLLGTANVVGSVQFQNNGANMGLIFPSIPNTIGSNSIDISKIVIKLLGTTGASTTGNNLLTNPSSCAAGSWTGNFTSYDGKSSPTATPAYTATGCSTVAFAPTVNTVFSNLTAGQTTNVKSTITLGANNSTIKIANVKMPQSVGPNFPSFGTSSDMCPGANSTPDTFNPAVCPAQAEVGSMTISTPLLPTALVGKMYLINKSPLPWFGAAFAAPGISLKLIGTTSTPQVDPACDPGIDFCQTQVSVTFNNVPDVPEKSIVVDLSNPARPALADGSTPGPLLVVAEPGSCLASDTSKSSITPWSGTAAVAATQTHSFTGC